ncbi:metallophosphoesterase family protein [Thalassoglobus sp.]|uniref:metallophosphoesterase family protein n=1 Tax=Thalassoglobus sp. TaxID=2795869 RepID=UPI003AA7DF70
MSTDSTQIQIGRRAFLQNGTLFLVTASTVGAAGTAKLFGADEKKLLRLGLVTDMHYADKSPRGSRYYRESLDKLSEAGAEFQKKPLDCVVELGDIIDAADSVETELGYLKTINKEFSQIAKERHYVLGNHCVDTLTKEEFLGAVEQEKSYYSFDKGGYHFIVLDSCFRGDGTPYQRKNFKWTDPNVPQEELEWLAADLKQTEKRVVVFAHQRLDVSDNHGVKNAPEVRQLLEESGKVELVFQGHSHKNDHKEIAGIHYCTMVAMVEGSGEENSGYSVLELSHESPIQIHGFRKQADYALK